MIVTIDRRKWHRGWTNSALYLSHNDKMCCLGFVGESCGIEKEEMCDIGTPAALVLSEIKKQYERWFPWLFQTVKGTLLMRNSFICESLMRVNDAERIGEIQEIVKSIKNELEIDFTSMNDLEESREQVITKIFNHFGVEVQFIN